jgi:hypothetical protein
MRPEKYRLRCLLCSAAFGRVLRGTLARHPAYQPPPHRGGGRLRCCYCGGSVYLEPIARYARPVARAELEKVIENSAAWSQANLRGITDTPRTGLLRL